MTNLIRGLVCDLHIVWNLVVLLLSFSVLKYVQLLCEVNAFNTFAYLGKMPAHSPDIHVIWWNFVSFQLRSYVGPQVCYGQVR